MAGTPKRPDRYGSHQVASTEPGAPPPGAPQRHSQIKYSNRSDTRDHAQPLLIADHRWSAPRPDFWHPTGVTRVSQFLLIKSRQRPRLRGRPGFLAGWPAQGVDREIWRR